jgi:hypothetical protein
MISTVAQQPIVVNIAEDERAAPSQVIGLMTLPHSAPNCRLCLQTL